MNNQPDSSLHSDKVHAGFLVERVEMIVLWDVDGQTVGVVPLLATLGSFARLGILTSEKLISERGAP